MRDFIKRALTKLNKLTSGQMEELLISTAAEIDRLETVLDSLNDGIFVCDAGHRLVMANKYAQRLLSMGAGTGAEQGSVPLWAIIGDEKAAGFFEKTLLSGDRVEERELDVEFKGISRLLSISVLPLVRDHQVTGSLIYIEDITEKRGKEARLRRAENLASLTTLAAGVAHEIKNPLGSISIHLQLMQKAMAKSRELFNPDRPGGQGGPGWDPVPCFDLLDKYTAVINEELERLNRIVVDFLFAVRPMNVELREGNINTLIGELVEFVRFEMEASKITCVLELDEAVPLLLIDERYMKQALLNLIKNAQAAMQAGSGGKLTIGTEKKDTEVLISVCDTGPGIPEDILSKIFEPYFTTKETGSGLGLTLVFKIIREHQGEITVQSRKGEGACFVITLPIPQKERRLIAWDGMSGEGAGEGGNEI